MKASGYSLVAAVTASSFFHVSPPRCLLFQKKSEKGYERDPKRLGKDRDYTLIMENEMGTKEWLQSHSAKDSKEVQNRDKVIIKDQKMGSYGVGSELLDEYNSKVESATLIDENGKQIETCKKG